MASLNPFDAPPDLLTCFTGSSFRSVLLETITDFQIDQLRGLPVHLKVRKILYVIGGR